MRVAGPERERWIISSLLPHGGKARSADDTRTSPGPLQPRVPLCGVQGGPGRLCAGPPSRPPTDPVGAAVCRGHHQAGLLTNGPDGPGRAGQGAGAAVSATPAPAGSPPSRCCWTLRCQTAICSSTRARRLASGSLVWIAPPSRERGFVALRAMDAAAIAICGPGHRPGTSSAAPTRSAPVRSVCQVTPTT
jgi:hypothetical protein